MPTIPRDASGNPITLDEPAYEKFADAPPEIKRILLPLFIGGPLLIGEELVSLAWPPMGKLFFATAIVFGIVFFVVVVPTVIARSLRLDAKIKAVRASEKAQKEAS